MVARIPGRIVAGVLLLGVLRAAWVGAATDLVVVPAQDRTQLTIFNALDLTQVRETRAITLTEGENRIQFAWPSNAIVDPTSARLRFLAEGPTVRDVVFPAGKRDVAEWIIASPTAGSFPAELSYFTGDLTWSANYTLILDEDGEVATLEPWFRIDNNSPISFTNAETRIVVGEPQLVEELWKIALAFRSMGAQGVGGGGALLDPEPADTLTFEDLAMSEEFVKEWQLGYYSFPTGTSAPEELKRQRDIIKTAVSELKLYSIEGTVTHRSEEATSFPDRPIEKVPVTIEYRYDVEKSSPPLTQLITFMNDEEHEPGTDAIPGGRWYVYQRGGVGGLRFVGTAEHKYAPIGSKVELELGDDGRVKVEEHADIISRRALEFDFDGNVTGHDAVHEGDIQFSNSWGREIPFRFRRKFPEGDWSLEGSSHPHEQIDRERVEWVLTLPPESVTIIEATAVHRVGSRSRTTPGSQP